MDNITNVLWWEAAAIRALKTFAQAFVAMCGAGTFLNEINWLGVISASTLAAILSIMTSLAGLPEVGTKHLDEEPDGDI